MRLKQELLSSGGGHFQFVKVILLHPDIQQQQWAWEWKTRCLPVEKSVVFYNHYH
jgi:hypothetical protein